LLNSSFGHREGFKNVEVMIRKIAPSFCSSLIFNAGGFWSNHGFLGARLRNAKFEGSFLHPSFPDLECSSATPEMQRKARKIYQCTMHSGSITLTNSEVMAFQVNLGRSKKGKKLSLRSILGKLTEDCAVWAL
jgi:hypothetical protein